MIHTARNAVALTVALMSVAGIGTTVSAQDSDYEAATTGTRVLEGGSGFAIKMLVEQSNLGGGEVEVGEITFPVGSGQARNSHTHTRVEIFYILEGELDHIVNDESHLLTPGMVGIVRPGDRVVHRVVSDSPVKALVIWAPGGEIERIAPNLRERPIGGGP